jgi:hypothetical protein
MTNIERFDVIVHLLGEQRLPVYLGINQFECPQHIIVHSGVHGEMQGALERLLPDRVRTEGVKVHPYDPNATKHAILDALGVTDGRIIGFNLTGGTKLMFAGASAACEEVAGVPFYFETIKNTLIRLDRNFKRSDVVPIESVDPFFTLAGFRVIDAGRWEDDPNRQARADLTQSLWPLAKKLAAVYRNVSDYNDSPGKPFCVQKKGVRLELDRSSTATIHVGDFYYQQDKWPEFARYISGGWFEEYCYLQLLPLLRQQRVRDLRIGLRIDWLRQLPQRNPLGAQEFDIAFTDGHVLYLIEVKAGAVRAEYVHSLENHVRHYGGVVAKGALVSVFRPSAESTIRRIRDSHCIGAFWAGAVSSEFHQRILSMEPGQTFGASPSRNKPRRKRPKAGFQPIEDAFREASR